MSNATILIADDDEDIRLALNLLLSAEGYQIIEPVMLKRSSYKVTDNSLTWYYSI